MPTIDPGSITQLIAAGIAAITALALGVQAILKHWNNNSTETSLLQMMHEELERMSTQNSILSQEIGKLQIELVRLSSQLTNLTNENQKLQLEVTTLHKEIARLHTLMGE